jgi:hypothetical protein
MQDMRPQITNESTRTFDVFRFGFESAGALGFDNEYSGLAVESRLAILASQNLGTHVSFAIDDLGGA